MKSFCPRKARKILNNLLCVTTHTLLNRKAGFERYDAKLHLFSNFRKKGDDLQLGIAVNMFVPFVSKSLFFIMKRIDHDTPYF